MTDSDGPQSPLVPKMPPPVAKSPGGGSGGDSSPDPTSSGDGSARSTEGPKADKARNGSGDGEQSGGGTSARRRRRRGGRGRGGGQGGNQGGQGSSQGGQQGGQGGNQGGQGGNQGGRGNNGGGKRQKQGGRGGQDGGRRQGQQHAPVTAVTAIPDGETLELDEDELERRRGRRRKGRPVGRYTMCVHSHGPGEPTQIAVLEGRNLIEHYVSRPHDDVTEIHGNIYLGKVQNVLPGMEAAFVDIGTPKNAVLYAGDVSYDSDEVDAPKGKKPRIEQMLKAGQTILCQVTKNPIAHKGARLTTEVSLPGRFVVFVPNQADTFGISKRLPDNERKRLRQILDRVRPKGHGLIVRTAAEEVSREEIELDVARLAEQWKQIEALAGKSKAPALLYTEPDMAVRVIREEFNKDHRAVIIDDPDLFEQVAGYMRTITPALAERIELHDPAEQPLSLFERFHVHEQLVKALDRKVWLPSGGSLIIEHTEALTVIDVNTGKNVGKSSLEETVFRNNLEAAEEIAKQLRLRDIGGIIVIDFVDMEESPHRKEVVKVFRDALARDKTRTQVFDITELGLVEMTRKRIGEGLLESASTQCQACAGRGVVLDKKLINQTLGEKRGKR